MSLIKRIFGSKTADNKEVECRKKEPPVLQITERIQEKVRLTIKLSADRDRRSLGSEAWLVDIRNRSKESLVHWRDYSVTSPLYIKKLGDEEKPALLFTEQAEATLALAPDSHLVFFCHSWSGIVELTSETGTYSFNLYSPVGSTKLIAVEDLLFEAKSGSRAEKWNHREQKWLDKIKAEAPEVLSIIHPDWRGVRSATENLVPGCLYFEDNLNEISAKRAARLIAATGCSRIFIGGFPLSYELIINELKIIKPDIRIFAFWLSSFLQSNEEYAWQSFMALDRLCRSGVVEKIGFAKKGMAETVARTGVRTGFVASCVRTIPQKPSVPKSGGPHIGIWALAPIWRKNPYAMIAAAAMIEDAHVFMVGQEQRAKEFADYLGVKVSYRKEPVPQERMQEALSEMDVNLYVTLSECSPMLPLESLAAGVPCLFGPTSHLFEDHSYLHSRLVVPYPDRSDTIAEMIKQCLEERERIVQEYIAYSQIYNNKAEVILNEFFSLPETANPYD